MITKSLSLREQLLIAQSQTVSVAGHSLHKGTPREIFIRDFLKDHLPSRVIFGTGEVIDHASRPGDERNQHDIVLSRDDFPKLNFAGDTNCYFAESIIATIEVKSTLTQKKLEESIVAARRLKQLQLS